MSHKMKALSGPEPFNLEVFTTTTTQSSTTKVAEKIATPEEQKLMHFHVGK